MNEEKKFIKPLDFQTYLRRQLKNPNFKKHYEEYDKNLEIAYAIIRLRKKLRLSQAELAHKIGTRQSNIARMESGQQNFTVESLNRVAKALGHELTVKFL